MWRVESISMLTVYLANFKKIKKKAYDGFRKLLSSGIKNFRHEATDNRISMDI